MLSIRSRRVVRGLPLVICCMASGLLAAGPASAGCPAPFNGRPCDGDTIATESDVCTVSTATISTITCDLGLDGEGTAPEAKFVTPTATQFKAYGVAGDGEAFCCELTVQDGCTNQTNTLYVYGTTNTDTMDLFDASAGTDMDCSNSYVYGEGNDDSISGSRLTTNNDNLYGDDDDDTIHGLAGGDTIHGGDSYWGDVLYGNDGADYIYGDGGDDIIYAGDGNDYAYGDDGSGTLSGDGKNHIEGGDGADHLYGGPYTDSLCGQFGDDVLDGNDGTGYLYGGAATGDTVTGGVNTDYCDANPPETTYNCENVQSTCEP